MSTANYPTRDEKTPDGSVIHWTTLHRAPMKSPKRFSGKDWTLTNPFVYVTCKCGEKFKMNVYTYKHSRHTTLCNECAKSANRLRGSNHPDWKGGRITRQDGYIAVTVSAIPVKEQTLFADMIYGKKQNSGKILEHRLVMARHLGRPLSRNEHVHHRNGIKTDNRIDNLELVSPSEHSERELTWARSKIAKLQAILKDHNIEF